MTHVYLSQCGICHPAPRTHIHNPTVRPRRAQPLPHAPAGGGSARLMSTGGLPSPVAHCSVQSRPPVHQTPQRASLAQTSPSAPAPWPCDRPLHKEPPREHPQAPSSDSPYASPPARTSAPTACSAATACACEANNGMNGEVDEADNIEDVNWEVQA